MPLRISTVAILQYGFESRCSAKPRRRLAGDFSSWFYYLRDEMTLKGRGPIASHYPYMVHEPSTLLGFSSSLR